MELPEPLRRALAEIVQRRYGEGDEEVSGWRGVAEEVQSEDGGDSLVAAEEMESESVSTRCFVPRSHACRHRALAVPQDTSCVAGGIPG
jgi:hypothetical protein